MKVTQENKIKNFKPNPNLEFAWIELTNKCNLSCLHCYTESSPQSGQHDLLNDSDYFQLLEDLSAQGCAQVQFIGGEPTLNRSLGNYIEYANKLGFEFIEVFTNLVSLSDSLLSTFKKFDVAIATSFYSYDADIHAEITNGPLSFNKTVKNITRVMSENLRLRVGIISMPQNEGHLDETEKFLKSLGVESISFDKVRNIGRADKPLNRFCESELCGGCAGGIISISPDGEVSPCAMSRELSIGSVLKEPLRDLLNSDKLMETRKSIWNATIAKEEKNDSNTTMCAPNECSPCVPCAPYGCIPQGSRSFSREKELVKT